jgi:hypothetical protein
MQKDSTGLSLTRQANEIVTGFIVQEVEQAAQSLDYDFSGGQAPDVDKQTMLCVMGFAGP